MGKELNHLEQVLVDTIQKATELTGNVIDFATAQIPDVIHQLLMWKLAESGARIVVCLIIIWVFFVIRKHIKEAVKGTLDEDVGPVIYAILGGIFLVAVPALLIIGSVMRILKIWIAPKLYLLEYAATLVK